MSVASAVRTSPMHSSIERLRPDWTLFFDMAVPVRFAEPEAEREKMRRAGLCDVTALPRIGIKGPGAQAWLEAEGQRVPRDIYHFYPVAGGGLVARVTSEEFLFEDGPGGNNVARLRSAVLPPGVYRVHREDGAVLLTGERTPVVLAETCGYDFGKPQPRMVMTRVANVSCAILAREIEGIAAFQLWIPTSFAEYLFDVLLSVVRDHGGDVIGWANVFPSCFDAKISPGRGS